MVFFEVAYRRWSLHANYFECMEEKFILSNFALMHIELINYNK